MKESGTAAKKYYSIYNVHCRGLIFSIDRIFYIDILSGRPLLVSSGSGPPRGTVGVVLIYHFL